MNVMKLLECEREIITKAILHQEKKFEKLKEKHKNDMERLFSLLKKVTEHMSELEKGNGDEKE